MPKYLSYALILLLGGVLGFLIGRGTASKSTTEVELPKSPIETLDKDNTSKPIPPEVENTIEVVNRATEDPLEDEEIHKPIKPLEVNAECFVEEKDLSMVLTLYAEKLEKDSVWYSSKNPDALRDCSGIFFRMLKEVERNCDQYEYPDHKKTRSSRAIARWYNSKNNLSLVHNPMDSKELIEAGSVLFFGGSGKKYANISMDLLANKEGGGEISHMGVVTEVKRDAEGNVIGYVMMHGHRKGKIAHRTHYHGIAPPQLNYPILGNWNQQWVAIANIMTAKSDKKETPLIADNSTPNVPNNPVTGTPEPSSVDTELPLILELPDTKACFPEDQLGNVLTDYSKKLEAQKIMYSQKPPEALRDCSGIFFRLTQHVAKSCAEYVYPNPKNTRNTKMLSKWFYKHGNLVIVKDASKILEKLKPGSVMFYGKSGRKYSPNDLTIDVISSSKGISHMGVVTELLKDESGKVIGYKLMHGRSTGKPAKRTLHYEKPPHGGFSGLGHWQQQLVAIANIMTPAPPGEIASR